MKKIIVFSIVLLLVLHVTFTKVFGQSTTKLIEFCAASAGDDATYLKDFYVELDAAGPDGKAPDQKFTLVLNKGNMYRFTICTAEGSEGKGMLQLYDMNKLFGSTYDPATGQTSSSINFVCSKTAPYHIFIKIIDGKKGSCVGILSFIKAM